MTTNRSVSAAPRPENTPEPHHAVVSDAEDQTAPDLPPALVVQGAVATITLRRPACANRLSPADLAHLRTHIDTVNQTESVRVLRLQAVGKYFCSGYDISSLADPDAASSLVFGQTVDLLEQARPVTVAVVHGGVYGGATDLALACDFRIGSKHANMFMPATRLGLHFYPGGLRRYVQRLGLDKAKRLFLTAERLDAKQMLDYGFLTDLAEPDNLAHAVQRLTQTLLEMAPLPLVGVKQHLNLIAQGQFDPDAIEQNVLKSERSSDIQEGARAWKEKRTPNFTGR